MSTLAQRNVVAFKAMKRIHSATVGDAKVEISPPGLIEIIERVDAEVGQEDVKAFAEGQIDVATILRKVPSLARWVAVRSLGGTVGAQDEIEEFVVGLNPDELFDLSRSCANDLTATMTSARSSSDRRPQAKCPMLIPVILFPLVQSDGSMTLLSSS